MEISDAVQLHCGLQLLYAIIIILYTYKFDLTAKVRW